jgi:hypothetical protein
VNKLEKAIKKIYGILVSLNLTDQQISIINSAETKLIEDVVKMKGKLPAK